jgi:hypothetical protein
MTHHILANRLCKPLLLLLTLTSLKHLSTTTHVHANSYTTHLPSSYFSQWKGNPNPDRPLATTSPTFVEFSHKFIDWLHMHRFSYFPDETKEYRSKHDEEMQQFATAASSLHFYESILLVEKSHHLAKPIAGIKAGKQSISYGSASDAYSGVKVNYSLLRGQGAPGLLDFV